MTLGRDTAALRIERDLPAIVAVAVRDIADVIPTYRTLSREQAADVEGIAFWSFRRLLQLWVSPDLAVDAADHAHFRAVGSARAYDGRPLSDVLRAYRVAVESLLRHIGDTYLTDLDTTDVADLGLVALSAIDTVYEQIISGWSDARDHLTNDRGRARAALLDDLLVGRQSSPGALADRTRELGLALPATVSLLAFVRAGDDGPVPDDDVEALGAALRVDAAPDATTDVLTTRRDTTVVVLAAPVARLDALEDVCRRADLRGSAATCALPDVATTFRRVARSLTAAPVHAFDKRAVLRDGDSHLLSLLAAQPGVDPIAVMTSILGPLVDHSHRHVLDGLAAFIATGTATEAAAVLHLHPQTLRYRLRRARELTGLDPRHGWDRLALDVAIHLRHLH
ncbi:PucR family transcriptional regulator [Rhodococcus sp. NPDC003994]